MINNYRTRFAIYSHIKNLSVMEVIMNSIIFSITSTTTYMSCFFGQFGCYCLTKKSKFCNIHIKGMHIEVPMNTLVCTGMLTSSCIALEEVTARTHTDGSVLYQAILLLDTKLNKYQTHILTGCPLQVARATNDTGIN